MSDHHHRRAAQLMASDEAFDDRHAGGGLGGTAFATAHFQTKSGSGIREIVRRRVLAVDGGNIGTEMLFVVEAGSGRYRRRGSRSNLAKGRSQRVPRATSW